jgi:hypothetical protein
MCRLKSLVQEVVWGRYFCNIHQLWQFLGESLRGFEIAAVE